MDYKGEGESPMQKRLRKLNAIRICQGFQKGDLRALPELRVCGISHFRKDAGGSGGGADLSLEFFQAILTQLLLLHFLSDFYPFNLC